MSINAFSPTYVDASGWIALVNQRDASHYQATKIYQERFTHGGHLVTTSTVLLEVGNWLSPGRFRKLALNLLDRINQSQRIEVVYIDERLYAEGWQLYRSRPDKDWGVIDCISFVVMQELNIKDAITADHHFEQAGFIKLL